MDRSPTLRRALLAACWLLGPPAGGQELADPGLEFFEYLGSWPVDDEEWLAVIEWEEAERGSAEKPPVDEEKDEHEEEP